MRDAGSGQREERNQRQQRQRLYPQQPAASRMPRYGIGAHPLAKKVEISSAGIAPSRMMRQRAPSSVRSTMVEATSRGEVPPLTMMVSGPGQYLRARA